MNNQLQDNLNDILQDKNTNLLPENLKLGITCLGVNGLLDSGISVVKNIICSESDGGMSDSLNPQFAHHYQTKICTGRSTSRSISRTYLKYDLSEIIDNDNIEILSAKLHFNVVLAADDYKIGSNYIFRCINDWGSDTLIWNNQPEVQSYINDQETPSFSLNVDLPYECIVDITNIVKSWVEDKSSNYGICIRGDEDTDSTLYHIATAKYEDGSYATYIDVQYREYIQDITLQEKSVDVTTNTSIEVVPDTNYYGLSKVIVNTNVPSSSVKQANLLAKCVVSSDLYPYGQTPEYITKENIVNATIDFNNLMFLNDVYEGPYYSGSEELYAGKTLKQIINEFYPYIIVKMQDFSYSIHVDAIFADSPLVPTSNDYGEIQLKFPDTSKCLFVQSGGPSFTDSGFSFSTFDEMWNSLLTDLFFDDRMTLSHLLAHQPGTSNNYMTIDSYGMQQFLWINY